MIRRTFLSISMILPAGAAVAQASNSDLFGQKQIVRAVIEGDEEKVRQALLKQESPNQTANNGQPLLVVATFAIPQMIIFEAALSFLGVGMPLEVVSWGSMLASGRNYLEQAWWIATLPGLAIMLTVLSVNILGDWLRDWLDPNLRLA